MVLKGTLKAFDDATYKADVQVIGARQFWLEGVPVSRAIASAEMVAGRLVAILVFDEHTATDAMIVGVH